MTGADLNRELMRLSRSLDEALAVLQRASSTWAQADADYRKAKAEAFLTAKGKTVRDREAVMELETDVERRRAHEAEAVKLGALEAVRSRRSQLSALQSVAAGHRAEAELARTGPEAF